MKKVILFAAILFSAVSFVNAKEDGGSTGSPDGTVKLNVHLSPIQTIVVGGGNTDPNGNPIQDVIDLYYKTDENYANGVSSEVLKDHITIVSTGGFNVNVKADDLKATTGDVSKTISAKTIKLDATPGQNFDGAAAYKNVQLENEYKLLAKGNLGATNKSFDITYKGSGDDMYINDLINNEETIYSTTVTYSIVAE